MARFETKTEEFTFEGAANLTICSLRDRSQFDDDDGSAADAGVSDAMWPIFGLIWASGRILAEHMCRTADDGARVLEIGCGLGMASLVMKRAGFDITASDIHPLARDFLNKNAELNGIAQIPFYLGDWATEAPELGLFDRIIGSDVLYDRGHAPALSGFIARHTKPDAEVIIVDANRGHTASFRHHMDALDFSHVRAVAPTRDFGAGLYRGQIIVFRRGISASAAR